MRLTLAILALATATNSLASIDHNLAYDSPSFRVPQLATSRGLVQRRHKRWDYYDGQVSFPYGVASGDPCESPRTFVCVTLIGVDPDSVILWTHPIPSTNDSRPICLEYQISASNTSWSTISSAQVWTTTDIDYSYKVEAGGLSPKKTYYYKFVNCADKGNASPVGRFKTIPVETDEEIDSVSFA